jgi:hypothetical protein
MKERKECGSILPNHSNEVDYLQDIKKILASKIPPVLVDDILTSYEKILKEFVSLNYEGTLKEGGIFVEHIRRVLFYLKENKVENEAPRNFENYMKDLRDDKNLSESLRIIIPRMTLPLYDLRSKRKDVVHVKENIASYMDAYFCVTACSWIIAELVREFYKEGLQGEQKIIKIIRNLMSEKIPIVEFHNGEIFVNAKVSCPDEILVILYYSSNGLEKSEILNRLKHVRKKNTVNWALSSLVNGRYIIKRDKRYYISSRGKQRVMELITKYHPQAVIKP